MTKHPLDELTSIMDEEEDGSLTAGFYDVDHYDNVEENEADNKRFESASGDFYHIDDAVNVPGAASSLSDFERDEDEILTEREDRFYIDENGNRRKVEKCILVGVEDLSEKRRLMKQRRNNMRYEMNGVDEEDMLFTLEESLVEMRELIKTAGMECVGGELPKRYIDHNSEFHSQFCTSFL